MSASILSVLKALTNGNDLNRLINDWKREFLLAISGNSFLTTKLCLPSVVVPLFVIRLDSSANWDHPYYIKNDYMDVKIDNAI